MEHASLGEGNMIEPGANVEVVSGTKQGVNGVVVDHPNPMLERTGRVAIQTDNGLAIVPEVHVQEV